MEMESRLEFTRDRREEAMGNYCLMGTEILFRVMELS